MHGGGDARVHRVGDAGAAGTVLVRDTLTGATAHPQIFAYGDACLTGAPRTAEPPEELHRLGGCPVDQVGPVPPGDAAPYGYPRLTDAGHDRAGAVLFEEAIPATDGLDATAPEPVPRTYKSGFAASTGDFTDVHLIRRLDVESSRPVAGLDLDKRFDGFVAPPGARLRHDAIRYRSVVTND